MNAPQLIVVIVVSDSAAEVECFERVRMAAGLDRFGKMIKRFTQGITSTGDTSTKLAGLPPSVAQS